MIFCKFKHCFAAKVFLQSNYINITMLVLKNCIAKGKNIVPQKKFGCFVKKT